MSRYTGHYGNERRYIIAWLWRDGFERLARSVEQGKLSARWAKELATTVPREHLDELTDHAERFGPRRPWSWQHSWEEELSLARHLASKTPDNSQPLESENQPDNCQVGASSAAAGSSAEGFAAAVWPEGDSSPRVSDERR